MVILALAMAAILCALQALRAARLLPAALWLAAVSALTSLLLYQLGAWQAAVIELSVGSGLVLILFVLAINLAAQPEAAIRSLVPRPLAWCLAGMSALLLAELTWPARPPAASAANLPVSTTLWQGRPLDVVVLVVLIFAGAVTVVGLLASPLTTEHPSRNGRAHPLRAPAAMERALPGAQTGGKAPPSMREPAHREIQPWR